MSPGSITSDFEATLIKSVRDQFPSTSWLVAYSIGSKLFVQIGRPRLPANQIEDALAPGIFDILKVKQMQGDPVRNVSSV